MLWSERIAVYPDGLAKTRSPASAGDQGGDGRRPRSSVAAGRRSCPAGERTTGNSSRLTDAAVRKSRGPSCAQFEHRERPLLAGLVHDVRGRRVDRDRVHADAGGVVLRVAGQHRAGRRRRRPIPRAGTAPRTRADPPTLRRSACSATAGNRRRARRWSRRTSRCRRPWPVPDHRADPPAVRGEHHRIEERPRPSGRRPGACSGSARSSRRARRSDGPIAPLVASISTRSIAEPSAVIMSAPNCRAVARRTRARRPNRER